MTTPAAYCSPQISGELPINVLILYRQAAHIAINPLSEDAGVPQTIEDTALTHEVSQ
jgi:hypothetical protein